MADKKLAKLRLVVEVYYDLNGDKRDNMIDQLRYVAKNAASNGLLSGDSNAEVETWDFWVEHQ